MKKVVVFIPVFFLTSIFSSCQSNKTYPGDNDNMFDKGSNIVFPKRDERVIRNLVLLGRIWGFLKYNHPKICGGKYNWDYELFRILPQYLNVTTKERRDKVLLEWLNKYGEVAICNTCKSALPNVYLEPDLAWISEQDVGVELQKAIKNIYNNRHQGESYYVNINEVGNPTFLHENPYADMPYPDQGFRLLTLFRFWNIIQYFSPYRNLTNKKWSDVLKEYIPRFLKANNELDYELITLELIGETDDTHAAMFPLGKLTAAAMGKRFAPFRVRFIENKLVVTKLLNPELKSNIEIGDVITHIGGKSVQKIVDSLWKYYPASNKASKLRGISFNILRSDQPAIEIKYISNEQQKKTLLKLFPADSLNLFEKPDEKSYTMLDSTIGYVTGEFKAEDIPKIKSGLKNTKGIIVDIRNGVSGNALLLLASYFVSKPTPFAKQAKGNIDNPGEFYFIPLPPIYRSVDETYGGKLVILVNEFTQSIGEFTAMAYRAVNNATIIGSMTAGTDGTACQVTLPGNLKTMITGNGIFYPDGGQTQRLGIIPDVMVTPSIEGVKQGKDEVLERAIETIKNK